MERPEVGPKGETRGIERVKSNEYSRMGSGFTGEFLCRLYSCLFANFVFQMCSAWAESRAEEDLSVPGEGKPLHSESAKKMTLLQDMRPELV
jgi:hypothetical protein